MDLDQRKMKCRNMQPSGFLVKKKTEKNLTSDG